MSEGEASYLPIAQQSSVAAAATNAGHCKRNSLTPSSEIYTWFSAITIGTILADLIAHPEGSSILFWIITEPERCYFCGYRYDHPIVKHDDKHRLYCGW